MIFYESPQRIAETLTEMAAAFGPERPAAVGRELTKKFEEFVRGTLAEVSAHFAAHAARGEITVVVQGLGGDSDDEADAEAVPAEPLSVPEALQAALASG